jgi:hypothetical protein
MLATVILTVAAVDGSVMVRVPVALPAFTVMVALVALVTVWLVIEAPVPPERVKVGVPGVPGVHEVPTPVRVTEFPVVLR